MHFLLLVNADEAAAAEAPPEEFARMMDAVAGFDRQIEAEGRKVGSIRLQAASAARTVRLRDGVRVVTDGPFVDTKEHLGGLWIIEAADMEEAISVADRLPAVPYASVEVRPVLSIDVLKLVQPDPDS